MSSLHKAVFLSLLLIASSCSRDPLDVDTSEVHIEPIKLLRLDRDLFEVQPNNITERTSELLKTYGPYYDHYIMGFIARGGIRDSSYQRSLLSFVGDRDIKSCQAAVQRAYPTEKTEELQKHVGEIARRFKFHFPDRKEPSRLVTCVSGWNYAFAYMDRTLSVSLDMYLGDTSVFYKMLQYPQYQRRRMNEQHLTADIARGWVITEFDKLPADNTLLNHTIFYGKMYYAVSALVRNTHDSLIIGYSGLQLQYCDRYEKNLWSYFAEKNRLYENDLNAVRELTSEGPFTGAISKDCPPRIAMWVGWQIVKSYMKNNKDISLSELMAEHDAAKILSKSKYRP